MANLKRGFSEPSGVAVLPVARPMGSKRGWAIPYRAIEPLAMACDALIIFATASLSDFVYSLEFTAGQGHIQQFFGFAAVVAALFIPLASNRDLYALPRIAQPQITGSPSQRQLVWHLSLSYGCRFRNEDGRQLFARLDDDLCCFRPGRLLMLARVGWRIYLRDGVAVRRFSSRKIALIAEEALSYDPGLHDDSHPPWVATRASSSCCRSGATMPSAAKTLLLRL